MLTLFLLGVGIAVLMKVMSYKPSYTRQALPEHEDASYRLYVNGEEQPVCCPNCHRQW